jgi:hypothetical protein
VQSFHVPVNPRLAKCKSGDYDGACKTITTNSPDFVGIARHTGSGRVCENWGKWISVFYRNRDAVF